MSHSAGPRLVCHLTEPRDAPKSFAGERFVTGGARGPPHSRQPPRALCVRMARGCRRSPTPPVMAVKKKLVE